MMKSTKMNKKRAGLVHKNRLVVAVVMSSLPSCRRRHVTAPTSVVLLPASSSYREPPSRHFFISLDPLGPIFRETVELDMKVVRSVVDVVKLFLEEI